MALESWEAILKPKDRLPLPGTRPLTKRMGSKLVAERPAVYLT